MPMIREAAELEALIGQEVGVGAWVEVTQDRVNRFADATGDHNWFHIDVERARRDTPYGGTIAHGYLTLSMIPELAQGLLTYDLDRWVPLNYGCNKVRFPAPVRVGRRVRARMTPRRIEPVTGGGFRAMAEVTVEIEGEAKPGCVAETMVHCVPVGGG